MPYYPRSMWGKSRGRVLSNICEKTCSAKEEFEKVANAMATVAEDPDVGGHKLELFDVLWRILSMYGHVLSWMIMKLAAQRWSMLANTRIHKLLNTTAPVIHKKGMQIPKLGDSGSSMNFLVIQYKFPGDFGNSTNFCGFWEQYKFSNHWNSQLSGPQKLGCLDSRLKLVQLDTSLIGYQALRSDYAEAIQSFRSVVISLTSCSKQM